MGGLRVCGWYGLKLFLSILAVSTILCQFLQERISNMPPASISQTDLLEHLSRG